MIRLLKYLAIVSTIGMIFVLVGGSLVTKTGSGMGCGPHWPLCNGQFFPSNFTPKTVIEFTHRLTAGVIGIIVLLLSYFSWRYIGHIREVKLLAILSSTFLIIQTVIGGAAVIWHQSDFILATHFGISLISFTAVVLLTLLIFEIDHKFDTKSLTIQKKHRKQIYALTIYVMVVIYTGAFVRHTESSMACGSWPFCFNPDPFDFTSFSTHQWIQMGHRLLAGILFIWTIILFIKIVLHHYQNRTMFWGWVLIVTLISLQVFLGAMIILSMVNIWVSLLHSFIITCYFSLLCYFVLLSTRSVNH